PVEDDGQEQPHAREVRIDGQHALERGGRALEVAVSHLLPGVVVVELDVVWALEDLLVGDARALARRDALFRGLHGLPLLGPLAGRPLPLALDIWGGGVLREGAGAREE